MYRCTGRVDGGLHGVSIDPINPRGKPANWRSDAHAACITDAVTRKRHITCIPSHKVKQFGFESECVRARARAEASSDEIAHSESESRARFPPRSAKRKTNERLRATWFSAQSLPQNCFRNNGCLRARENKNYACTNVFSIFPNRVNFRCEVRDCPVAEKD